MPPQGVYVGTIRHRRFAPTPHRFRYALFMVLVDVDRLPEAMAVSAFTAYNRRNWATFDDRDHFGDPARPLRERLRESAAAAGHVLPDGPVFLLTHLRYAGYVFNPVSLFYCYDGAGTLALVLAEVNNTFGGRRLYWLPATGDGRAPLRASAAKSLYVSPFMDPDVSYDFVLTPPSDRLVAHMNVVRGGGLPARTRARLFDATLVLERREWSAREIRRALLRFPFLTAKVIAAIHWEASRLWLKGLRVVPERAGVAKVARGEDGVICG